MAQKEKELCIGRKKFNMDPVKVGSTRGSAHGAGLLHAGHLHNTLSFPSADTITHPADEETEVIRAQPPVPSSRAQQPRREVGARRWGVHDGHGPGLPGH